MPQIKKRKLSHLIIDSSGLKLKGEGEWKDTVHRSKTRKSWIKLHLAIDAKTQEITACVISDEEAFKLWKKLRGYHKRSLVETAFSRLKGLFGNRLNSQKWDNQRAEIHFRLHAMNWMLQVSKNFDIA